MTQTLAPIAFFCYNRPDHTRRTLEALKANELASESKLFIFSDGPKDSDSAREGVAKVREYIRTVDGFASVEIIEREKNYSLTGNIVDGITRVVNEFGKIIVIEDDILTSPYFLRYVNDALELYKDDEKVGAVSGYFSPLFTEIRGKLPETFFIRTPYIWGWGTWQRVWKYYDYDAAKILEKIKAAGLEKEYNYGIIDKPRSRTLRKQAQGKVGSWDFQLSAMLFLHGMFSLTPKKAYSNNIGCDGTGVHCGTQNDSLVNVKLAEDYESLKKVQVELNQEAQNCIVKDIPSLPSRIVNKIRKILRGLIKKSQ